jgi:predicted transcriptional regulator
MANAKPKLQKATYQELADELGVTVSAVSKYPKLKRDLMLYGLKAKQIHKSNLQK